MLRLTATHTILPDMENEKSIKFLDIPKLCESLSKAVKQNGGYFLPSSFSFLLFLMRTENHLVTIQFQSQRVPTLFSLFLCLEWIANIYMYFLYLFGMPLMI